MKMTPQIKLIHLIPVAYVISKKSAFVVEIAFVHSHLASQTSYKRTYSVNKKDTSYM